jgi:hypothetical protein
LWEWPAWGVDWGQGGDARSLLEVQFDDVLTSPPYIDSIDYVYNQMLEYFWLLPELGVNSYEEFRSLRKIAMGLGPVETGKADPIERTEAVGSRLKS